MGNILRKLLLGGNSVLSITVDTTLGDGLPTYELPITNTTTINAILKVSDGRADEVINTSNMMTKKNITFATGGIYVIKLVGKGVNIGTRGTTNSKQKLISINSFGYDFKFYFEAFTNCSNLVVNTIDSPNLVGNVTSFFSGIKNIASSVDLSTWDFSRTTSVANFISGTAENLNSVPQGFMGFSNGNSFLYNAKLASITKIEIISDSLTDASLMFTQSNFRGRLIMKTPNLKNIDRLVYGYTNVPSLGEVDIRNVDNAGTFTQGSSMTQANVDATLLGWVNNFDWSAIAPVTNKFIFRFAPSSKYSNSTAVIAAKAFLEAKGIVFSNLTMA